jgi:hypothetical protein
MTVETLIEYLQFLDAELEVRVCKRTKATIPCLNPWAKTEDVEVDLPLLCSPTQEIECLVHDKVTPNAPVLLVIG